MTIYNPLSEAQFLVQFSKFGSFFFTEIVLKAPFDPRLQARLDPVITAWSCQPGTIIITPVDCSGQVGTNPGGTIPDIPGLTGVTPVPIGEPYYYDGARIKKYTPPNVNRKSADAAMIELEFVVNSLRPRGKYSPGTNSTGNNNDILKTVQDFLKSTIA
jgi:hypothetical protein